MRDLLLRGGRVLTEDGLRRAEVRIVDGVVASVGPDPGPAGEIIDCTGAWIGPGFVDVHAHLREPGEEWKEDVASASAAAAAGGYTAIVAMPNTTPPIDAGHLARFVAGRGAEAGLVEVVSAGCISEGRAGRRLAHLDDLWDAGVRLFTDDGDAVSDAGLMRRALEYLGERGGVLAQHAVDPGLAAGGHLHEGAVSSLLGLPGIPAEAEEIVLARDLALVARTGTRYHVQHLATARGVELVAAAKEAGLPVTAEVTPHHLAFDHRAVLETDPVFKMMPPLRAPEDVAALRSALRAGIVDMVATDHAPHASHEKDVPFEEAPNGVIGLEWAGAIVRTCVGLDAEAFFDRLSTAPARLAGFEHQGGPVRVGGAANLTVFDPERTWVPEGTVSRATNTPYLGMELRGRVVATIHRGRVTAREGRPVAVTR